MESSPYEDAMFHTSWVDHLEMSMHSNSQEYNFTFWQIAIVVCSWDVPLNLKCPHEGAMFHTCWSYHLEISMHANTWALVHTLPEYLFAWPKKLIKFLFLFFYRKSKECKSKNEAGDLEEMYTAKITINTHLLTLVSALICICIA